MPQGGVPQTPCCVRSAPRRTPDPRAPRRLTPTCRAALFALLSAAGGPGPAWAQATPGDHALGTIALDFAGLLTAAEAVARPRVSDADVLAQAADDEPLLDAHPVVRAGVGAGLTPGGLELEGGISQSLALSGTRGARRAALDAEARWARADVDARVLERRLEAARRWLDLWAAQAAEVLLEEDRGVACRAAGLLEARQRAGEATTADVDMLAVACTEAELAREDAEGTTVEHALALAGVLPGVGATPAAVRESRAPSLAGVRAEGPLPLLPEPTTRELALARERLDAWPALAREAAVARLERARATEEAAARGLRVDVGVVGRRSADGTSAVLGTLSLPLPLWTLGGREVASREAAALRAEHAVTLDRARLAAELEQVVHEVAHWDHLEARTREVLVPRAEALARARLRQLELGEATVLEALDARRSALAARQRALEAARARAWAHIHARVVVAVLAAEAP